MHCLMMARIWLQQTRAGRKCRESYRRSSSATETWLIFYGDVHVGTISMGSGNPSGGDQWSWHCGFYPGSNPGDATNGTATNFGAARAAFESAWSVFLSERTGADFSGIPALPCIRCLEARDVGPGLQAADPGCGRPLVMLLWHGDWDREHGPAHQRGASGDEMKRAPLLRGLWPQFVLTRTNEASEVLRRRLSPPCRDVV